MATTRPATRIAALMGALLFFFTSAALSIAVILQVVNDNKTKTDTTTQPSAADIKKATDQAAAQQQSPQTTKTEANKLQGTKLADFTPVDKIDELKIADTKEGTGDAVTADKTVTVDYTGAVAATGVIFQSSLDSGQQATFGLNQVIKGWTEGIPGMKVGGTRRLLIPADKAYGANPPSGSGIPANADLVFDVTLHAVK